MKGGNFGGRSSGPYGGGGQYFAKPRNQGTVYMWYWRAKLTLFGNVETKTLTIENVEEMLKD